MVEENKEDKIKEILNQHVDKLGPDLVNDLTGILADFVSDKGLEKLEDGIVFALPECTHRHCAIWDICKKNGCQEASLPKASDPPDGV